MEGERPTPFWNPKYATGLSFRQTDNGSYKMTGGLEQALSWDNANLGSHVSDCKVLVSDVASFCEWRVIVVTCHSYSVVAKVVGTCDTPEYQLQHSATS